MKGVTFIQLESLASLPNELIDFCLLVKQKSISAKINNRPNPNFPLIRIYLSLFDIKNASIVFNALQNLIAYRPNQMEINPRYVDIEFCKQQI